MEEKVFSSWENTSNENEELLEDAIRNPGKPIITLDQLTNKIEYKPKQGHGKYRPSIHIGQRKLFINELQFLNKHITPGNYNNFVIYAGGSPGHHMYELSRYYPDVKFIIIDPSRHQSYITDILEMKGINKCDYQRVIYYDTNNKYIKKLDNLDQLNEFFDDGVRILILQQLCTSELLLDIKSRLPSNSNIYLWSDIRTNDAESGKYGYDKGGKRYNMTVLGKERVTDGDITWNLVLQYNWLKSLEPDVCMFKFRLPFYKNDIDNIKTYMENNKQDFDQSPELDIINNYNNKTMLYPKGKIYIQPWQGVKSTESRLVIKKSNIYNLIKYDSHEYDDRFNYYNLIERVIRKHNNGTRYYKYGYCECNDCAIELDTFKEYVSRDANKNHIIKEFNINKLAKHKIIGTLCTRLGCIFGTKLEGVNEHGINRYPLSSKH